ncbi:MAG: aminoacyl-tRNA hydrolase [Pelolinea sp.]|nr:aminoacyl-tRNA hydrolase [Pelolinea sp.]
MIFRKLAALTHLNHFLIIGLGNPGREYELTRHNIGFLVIDRQAERWGVEVNKYKFKALLGEYRKPHEKVVLVKPQTFMNLSGSAVRSFYQFYKPQVEQVLVIFDDLDLPFGTIRIRKSGGSSGHKGMKSIIEQLGTEKFPRIRVGIGRPPGRMNSVNFILNKFKTSENKDLELILDKCVDVVECFIENGIETTMNRYNGSVLDDE